MEFFVDSISKDKKNCVRKIVQASVKNDYGGRVSLCACTGSIPQEFMRICGYGKIADVSCAIKYKKRGFNSIVPEIDKKFEQAIANNERGLVFKKTLLGLSGWQDTLTSTMELSEEAIQKFLQHGVVT